MSCNTCPLIETCRSNMELERQIGLFAVESDYQNLQNHRRQEWAALADAQPIYVDADDRLVGLDKRLLQAESTIIASNEMMDRVDYSLKKSAFSSYLDSERLKKDEAGCSGPSLKRRWRIFGKKVLFCSSQSRLNRVQAFEDRFKGSHD